MAKKEKKMGPGFLYNEKHGRENGMLFKDRTEFLEALASGEWWNCWTGPVKKDIAKAKAQLGIVEEKEPEKPKDDGKAKIISRPKGK